MGQLTDDIEAVIARVKARVGADGKLADRPSPLASETGAAYSDGVFPTIDAAVDAAWTAHQRFKDVGLDRRKGIIEEIRRAMREQAAELGRLAWQETGIGRPEDKRLKNLLVTDKTPGPEDLESDVRTGDFGLTVTEYAPYGVIGAVTPTTNPTSTIINNSIATISAGNAIVFNVHPNAKQVSVINVREINRAIARAGGPPNLATCVPEPTLESAQALMEHPRARILLVTGGPGVVQAALATRKRAITAGPGNPPVVVDGSADLDVAGREIVNGASFDNNVICVDEKEVFVVREKAEALLQSMQRNSAVLLKEYQLRQLEKVIFKELGPPGKPGKINPRWIGKNAGEILGEIGVQAGPEVRLALADVPRDHSLVWTEQMMPVLPVVRVAGVDEAIDLAVRAEHGFGHTATIYSQNVDNITRMARTINVSIFVANGPSYAGLGQGGEGYTSFSIASPTGEGLTRPRTFSRLRRMTVKGGLRIV
jgi:acyl-CoA reductase-like NAD-dependent aldehyde dehydrogenase